jgi:hypothetical protein
VARIAAACALALAAACEPAPEPRLAATCAPDVGMDGVTCTVKNHGNKASRACLRARIVPEASPEIITRRVCTAVLGPGESAEARPPMEKLGRIGPAELLGGQCVKAGQWTCKVEVVETSREMAEDHPRER